LINSISSTPNDLEESSSRVWGSLSLSRDSLVIIKEELLLWGKLLSPY